MLMMLETQRRYSKVALGSYLSCPQSLDWGVLAAFSSLHLAVSWAVTPQTAIMVIDQCYLKEVTVTALLGPTK